MDFSSKIISWYKKNKRDLPWRKTKNPYHIWLSEIILQQTQVKQGLPYYEKFVLAFPTVKKLAQSDESEVLNLWQGLGYYSRGRNLHFTAKYICDELKEKFPNDYKELIKLKGVGDYTASAIASFAFNEKVAPVDGNVIRVITRYFGIEDDVTNAQVLKRIRKIANQLLPENETSTYNQGMMEFGALHCKPKSPKCNICPLNIECIALKNNTINKIPYKSKKTKVKERYLNYLVFTAKNKVLIKKRTEKDIWQNLYDFPLIESFLLLNFEDKSITDFIRNIDKSSDYSITVSEDYKHILSHQKLHVRFFKIELKQELELIHSEYKLVPFNELDKFGKPILIQNYLNKYIL